MKRTLLLSVLSLAFGIAAVAQTQDPVVAITTKIANQGSYVTGYDKEFTLREPGSDLTWTAKNFNNNNSAWDNIRCGSKTEATTATITTDFAITKPICNVEVELTRYKTGSTNRMTSMSLLVSPNADMSESTSYPADISTLPAEMGESVTITIPVADPLGDMYYQLSIDMPKVSSEGVFSVNSLKYYTFDPEDELGVHTVILDFMVKDSILEAYRGENDIAPGSEYGESGTNNLNGASFAVGEVTLSLSKAEGTIQPRWWEAKNITPELRLNPDNTLTIETAKEACHLLEVKFLQGTAADSYYAALDSTTVVYEVGDSISTPATLINRAWTTPTVDVDSVSTVRLPVNRLTMTFRDYCRCGAIRITYLDEDEVQAGIDTITLRPTDSSEAPLTEAQLEAAISAGRIYDFMGRCITSRPAPGIYIVDSKKVLIR